MRAFLLAVLFAVGCAPRAMPLAADHPANPEAEPGRLAGPPSALRAGVAHLEEPTPRSGAAPSHDHTRDGDGGHKHGVETTAPADEKPASAPTKAAPKPSTPKPSEPKKTAPKPPAEKPAAEKPAAEKPAPEKPARAPEKPTPAPQKPAPVPEKPATTQPAPAEPGHEGHH